MDTSWEVIKKDFVGMHKSGTVGHIRAIQDAMRLFMALRSYLSDLPEAEKAVNADKDVGVALSLEDMGKALEDLQFE